MPETSPPSSVDVLTQLITGPSLTEVASHILRPALALLYPPLELDPALAMVATPTWVIEGDDIEAGPCGFESLTDVLVHLALSGATVAYIDGEHFLTMQPGVEPFTQLPVEIEAIGAQLNELAPLLFIAYQERQIDFWNESASPDKPRWHQLSQTLQQLWNVSADNGWDADQRAIAHAVFNAPDKTRRLPGDPYNTRACLIDLDLGSDVQRKHLNILDTAVLVGTVGERTLILTHSITEGYQRFDSFEDLGKSLRWSVAGGGSAINLRWRLFEPAGNFFDYQACTLIALEAQTIGAIDFFQRPQDSVFLSRLAAANQQNPLAGSPKSHYAEMEHSLPQWLENATPADQTRYSRHLLDLIAVQQQNAGKTFQSEVPDIRTFTLKELRRKIDQAPTRDFVLQDVEITIDSVVVWGTFVPPGHPATLTLSLVELALENLVALPLGNKSVRYQNNTTVPHWMTSAYLEGLVTSVNIGKTYPELLQDRLIDDTAEAARLQQLYSRQLPIELSLLALQNKVREEAGIDEQGYRYVVAALAAEPVDRWVDDQEIVVRPLAFITGDHSGGSADEVVNMFVISPRYADAGPCLLYRPLLDPPLLQYPSPANLLYAIKHSRTLRQSVLAWLPDSVRFNYSQYVFAGTLPSVWTVPQLLVDPSLSPDLNGPVALGDRVLEQDLLATLFKANAEALITQADRQSVSNAEARWASLKRGGWALFNAALPFLGRSVGTAAWIWQIIDDLQEVTDASEQQQPAVAWSALADVLLSIAMVLAHRAAVRTKPKRVTSSTAAEKAGSATPAPEPASISATRLTDIAGHELPARHELSLHDTGALQRSTSGLGPLLDSLKISPPEGLGAAQTEGTHRHLSGVGQKWYARVGVRWFEVELNDNDDVQIIDSRQQPSRHGPLLISNALGEWFVDVRLRLRGGGLKNRRTKMRQQNQALLREKKADIKAFDAGLDDKRLQLFNARRAMDEATPETAETARQQFLDTLESQIQAYSSHLDEIKALNILEAVPNYRTAMLDRISLQLFLMQSWLEEQYPEFRESLRYTLELLDETNNDPVIERSEPFEKMTGLTQGIIDKIEFAHTRFTELSLLGKEAAEVSREYKAKLPPFALQDLKMLQITLGQELCLNTDPAESRQQARIALESLIEDATLNIQSALDLSADEGLDKLGERVEALNNLVEQFEVVDQRFADLATEFATHLIGERLEQVRKRVAGFHQDAVQSLSNMLRERRLVEPIAGPSKSPAAPTRKIIKTRYKGTLVGQPRRSENGQESDLVDVVAPITGKVIATFHEKSPGVWLERVPVKPPAPPKATPDLPRSVQAGQALLDELPAFNQRTEAHIRRAARNPTETEEVYYLHAMRLREAMDRIDQALTSGNHTQSRSAAANALRLQLESQATALFAKGRATRIELTKQQAPTAARVEWLIGKGEVTVGSASQRRRLKGPGKDYLTEYEVLDKQSKKVLWYAHFHYEKANDPRESFTAAHLKTVEQRKLGGAFDWRENGSNLELIAIHRAAISRAQATALFFT